MNTTRTLSIGAALALGTVLAGSAMAQAHNGSNVSPPQPRPGQPRLPPS